MKVSIITINFNNLEGLKKTVKSVISQTYHDIEYIIIDGASTDGSADYVKENKEYFNYWVSEPDKGIYNAMNKGIDHATGDYLLFLNSGDYLVDENVIEKFVGFDPVEDIVYGEIFMDNNVRVKKSKYPSKPDVSVFFSGALAHPAMLFKKELFDVYGKYREDLKIVSDWEYYFRLFMIADIKFRKIDLFVSVFMEDGISSMQEWKHLQKEERKKVKEELIPSKFIPILNKLKEVESNYNGLLSSGTVKVALKVSSVLNKIKSLFNGRRN